jgi:lipoprotein signal peptidase
MAVRRKPTMFLFVLVVGFYVLLKVVSLPHFQAAVRERDAFVLIAVGTCYGVALGALGMSAWSHRSSLRVST